MRSHSHRNRLLLIIFILLLFIAGFLFIAHKTSRTIYKDQNSARSTPVSDSGFSFSAAGDFDSTEEAKSVLDAIGNNGGEFTLALGDLGYVGNGNEEKWCAFVLSSIGNDHPFQLIAGNHDDGSKDGDIKAYIECLPSKMSDTVGEYGIEYYFDYNNLARFIMISPDIDNYGYDYIDGSENLKWVESTIAEARDNGIEWIILGMHKNCITPGQKTCEIGEDLLNVAIKNGVDIILQGHEHGYFRSKQIKLNEKSCPAIIVNNFNQSCISNENSNFNKGDGTIIVISGAGGRKLRDVNPRDSEVDYFESLNGANLGSSYGYSLFDVSENKITSSFMPTEGSFTDFFVINGPQDIQ